MSLQKNGWEIAKTSVPYLLIIIIALTLWVPFGLNITPLIEMWFMRNQVESINGIVSSFTGQPDRFFWFWSVLLGYWLSPDTFVGQQIVYIGVYISKGILTYLILLKLFPKLKIWALTVALLSLFCPADRNGFWLGALHVHAHNALFLFTIYLFLLGWKKTNIWRWVFLILIQNIVLWSYEGTLALNMAVPALLIYLENPWKLSRRVIKNSLLWYISPIFAGTIRIAMFANSANTHIARKIDNSFQGFDIADGIIKVFYMLFVGWFKNIKVVFQKDTFLLYAGVIFVFCFIYLVINQQKITDETNKNTNNIKARIFVGVTLIILGFLPYALTDILRYRYDRTSTLPWIGASIIFITIVWEIAKNKKRAYITFFLSCFLIASTVSLSLHYRQKYLDVNKAQDQILTQIVLKLPYLKEDTAILILCEDCPRMAIIRYDSIFEAALEFIYKDDSLRGFVYSYSTSDPPSNGFSKFNEFPLDRLIVVRYIAPDNKVIIEDTIPAGIIREGKNDITQYAPSHLYESVAPIPYRACLLFDEFFTNTDICETIP